MQQLKRFLTFDDVGLIPKFNNIRSRLHVSLETKLTTSYKTNIPFIPANMDTVIGTELANVFKEYGGIGIFHRFTPIEKRLEWLKDFPDFFQSCGVSDWEATEQLINKGCKNFCIDIAHGHSVMVGEMIQKIKSKCPDAQVIAGNVCTVEGFDYLATMGADAIKCGVGPGCLAKGTRILMASGVYKNIEDIKIGDYIINKDGNPAKVLNTIQSGIKTVNKLKSNLSYEPIFSTKNHQVWIGDLSSSEKSLSSTGIANLLNKKSKTIPKTSKYKWKEIYDCNEKNTVTLFPKNIKWKLEENFKIDLSVFLNKGIINETKIHIEGGEETVIFNRFLNSNYDLGYIFGTFLGDGCCKIQINKSTNCESGCVSWFFGYDEDDICNKLINSIENTLGIKCKIKVRNDNVKIITLYNKCVSKLFFEFDKKTNKTLPEKYYCKNIEYIKGIFDGLVDSDGHIDKSSVVKENSIIYCFTNTSKNLIELFQWCCMNLNLSYSCYKRMGSPGGLQNITDNSIFNDSYRIKTHTFNRFTNEYLYSNFEFDKDNDIMMDTFDLEIDCPSNSFIANNIIVHNSACSTRMVTGVGVPQFSAVYDMAKYRDLLHNKKGKYIPIIADGGIRDSRDICLALAAGADTVMMGSIFCKTFESACLKFKDEKGNTFGKYRGQASANFQNEYFGQVKKGTVPEGIDFTVKITKSAKDVIEDFSGALRSSMTYLGASNMKEYHMNAEFFESTMNFLPESKPRKEDIKSK